MVDGSIPPEERHNLRAILEQLKEELENAPAEDGPTRERLETLARETQNLLDEEGELSPEAHKVFNSRLSQEMAHFEGSHPDLAYVIAQVIETLSGLGI